ALPRWQPSRWPRRLLVAALPLAAAAGLAIGWVRNQSVPAAAVQAQENNAPGPRPVDPFTEREQALLKVLHEQSGKSFNPLKTATELTCSIELGLLYLSEPEHLHDAELFFKKTSAKQGPQYKALARLGSAMVLAFKDQPEQSNKLFLEILGRDKAA